MKRENLFYLIIVFTVSIVRLIVFLYPKHIVIYGVLIHHFWIGLSLILITILFFRKNNNFKLIFIGVGLGFVIDELGFMILGSGDFLEYWSFYPIILVGFLLIIILLFRKNIHNAIFK